MEQSSCTEDRIHHVLQGCLASLGQDSSNAALCVTRWCLEELVKREACHFLILLQHIVRKAEEVLERCQYELVVPLTLLFSSALLKVPHWSPGASVLQEAYELFHSFLSWPEPCCSASKRLLQTISLELRAPGISFQRLVREEQGVAPGSQYSKTITVLMLSPAEDVPPELQSVSEQLTASQFSQKDVAVGLIAHAFQAVLGAKFPNTQIQAALRWRGAEEVEKLLSAVTVAMETAASSADPGPARQELQRNMERLAESFRIRWAGDDGDENGSVEMAVLPFAKCHVCLWNKDNFDNLSDILARELDKDLLPDCFHKSDVPDEDDEGDTNGVKEGEEEQAAETEKQRVKQEEEEEEEEVPNHRMSTVSSSSRDSVSSSFSLTSGPSESSSEDTDEGSPRSRRKPKKKSRSILGIDRLSLMFISRGGNSICHRARSMGHRGDWGVRANPANGPRAKRSESLPRQVGPQSGAAPSPQDSSLGPRSPVRHVCVRRRPILSCNDDDAEEGLAEAPAMVRVVVFGGDREAGRLARAYSDLQQRERRSPRLTRACRLQFFFIPARRRSSSSAGRVNSQSNGPTGSPMKAAVKPSAAAPEESSTDIAELLGVMDPWYRRSVLSLLSLSSDVLYQTTCKAEGDSGSSSSSSSVQCLPLLADLVMYYCRAAQQPALVQLYQAELTLAGGGTVSEVFIHSLELGHTAGTRAVRAMGAASKRFGIDGDREAVPLPLAVAYNKVTVSGRSQWTEAEMVCTSVNLRKDSRIESLQLTMIEVLKRQSSKSKKGYNQHISISAVKVDRVWVSGEDQGTTFAVCLDRDEKRIIQSVTRCEVWLCCKPGSSSDWRSYKPLPGQVRPLHSSYRSLLCLPINTFTSSNP